MEKKKKLDRLNDKDFIFKCVGIFFISMGILGVVAIIINLEETIVCTKTTPGYISNFSSYKVNERKCHLDDDDGYPYCRDVERTVYDYDLHYYNNDLNEYKHEYRKQSKKLSEPLTVYYNPKNPKEYYIKGENDLTDFLWYIICTIGTFFIAISSLKKSKDLKNN